MKNTVENKAKFFAQYWGQNILRYEPDLGYHRIVNDYKIGNADEFVAELKPLSQITDEDAIDLAKNHLGWSEPEDFKMFFLGFNEGKAKGQLQVDFLRSKGYALPWLNISVEEQIEWGWVKLKQ